MAPIGSVEPLRRLHARWGSFVHVVEVLVRQAHPGPQAPAYHHEAAKRRDAERYRQAERTPWPVAVDDLAGPCTRPTGPVRAGHTLRPVLTRLTHRSRPLPPWLRGVLVVAMLAAGIRRLSRRTARQPAKGSV